MNGGALATGASTTCSSAKAERSTTSACGGCTVNQVWSLDFVMDSLASGRRIKCLTVVDDFSRECVDIAVDPGIGGEYVTRLARDRYARRRGSLGTGLLAKDQSSPAAPRLQRGQTARRDRPHPTPHSSPLRLASSLVTRSPNRRSSNPQTP